MKKKAFIFIILAGMFWGTSGIFVHFLAPLGLTSMQMTCIRGVVSVLTLTIFALIRDRKFFRTNRKDFGLYFLGGASMFLTATCYYAAMQMTTVSTAVVLMYIAPILVMIYSVMFLGEKLTPLKIAAVVCMVIGCGLVSGVVGGLKFDLLGIIIGVISGITYTVYNIATKVQMKRGCNPVTSNTYCFLVMGIIALVFSKPWQIAEIAVVNPTNILLMVGCGICTCIIPYFLYSLAFKSLPAGTVSALGVIEPMAATLYSVTLLGEKLDIFSTAGIVLILGAVFMLSRAKEN